MATNIKLKSSSLTGKTPTLSDLSLRELAVNTADGKLFLRKGDGSGTDKIIDVTGPLQASEPMGHEDKTQSAISFNTTNRRFTIQPVSTSFNVWCKGIKYTYTTAQTVDLPNTSGIYYIYFDGDGVLQYRQSYFDWENEAPTAYVYWNATTGTAPFVADERHGIVLDWQTHEYLHRTRGAVIANGFSISNYTTSGTGANDADAQFDLGGGTFFDEDLEVLITHSNTPTSDTWQQDLQGPSQIPVFYQSGNAWVRDSVTSYALKQGTARIQYNYFNGASWSAIDVPTNTHYTTSWIIATNNINYPVIAIMGQTEHNKISDQESIGFGDLVLAGFPVVEFRPLWKIIWQTDSGYANTPNARIAGVYDIRQLSAGGGFTGATPVSDHGLLTGLGDDDHLQYFHLTNTRTGITAELNTTSKITTTNRIGIGTTNPTSSLHLAGIGTTSPTGDANRIRIGDFHWDNLFTSIHAKKARSEWWLEQNSDDDDGVDLIFYKSRGVPNAELPVQVNDNVFRLTGRAFKPNAVGIGSTITTADWSGDELAQIEFDIDEISGNNVWGRMNFKTQSLSRMMIKSSGNIGIGTTNPTERLDIVGNINLTGELRGPASFVIDPAAVGDNTGTVIIKGDLQVDGTTTTLNSTTLTIDDKNITIADGVTTLANLDAAGIDFGSTAVRLRYNYNSGTNSGLSIEGTRVGIGTTNIVRQLHLNGVGIDDGIRLGDVDFFAFDAGVESGSPTFRNSVTDGKTILRVIPNGTGFSQFEFFGNDYYDNVTSWNNIRLRGLSSEFILDVAHSTSGVAKPLIIETNASDGGLTRNNQNQLYLATSGNVGIATSNPTSTLHVQGTALVTGNATFQGNVYLGDNDIIHLGDANDLQIYHNLSDNNGYIVESNPSGSLLIRGSNIYLQNATGTTMLALNSGSSVDLYHNGSKKLETTANGVTVTGTLTTTGSYETTNVLTAHGSASITDGVAAAINQLSATTYRSVEYTIQATVGTNYHVTKILAIHNGTDVNITEYGTIFTNISVATYSIDISGGNIVLTATPDSASQTTFKISYVAIKV